MFKNKLFISILSINLLDLKEYIEKFEKLGVYYLHIDIMDGYFVKNITFCCKILSDIKKKFNKIKLDVHLMVIKPEYNLKKFLILSDIITIHYETITNLNYILKNIKKYKKKICIALNPNTSIYKIKKKLKFIDQILIMTVNPGYSGQKFIYSSLYKINELYKYKKKNKLNYDIAVDGGINLKNLILCKNKGANIFIIGSYIFKKKNLKVCIKNIKKKIGI